MAHLSFKAKKEPGRALFCSQIVIFSQLSHLFNRVLDDLPV